jgi:hypothetical protein
MSIVSSSVISFISVSCDRCLMFSKRCTRIAISSKRHHDLLLPPNLPPADSLLPLTGMAVPRPPDLFRCSNGFVVWTKEIGTSLVVLVSALVDVLDGFAHVVRAVSHVV